MEDLAQQIDQLLSDPQQLRQLQGMLGSLNLGGAAAAAPPVTAPAPPPPAPAPDEGALQLAARVAPLLGQLRQEDDATRLLQALRPLLSQARREKLDEAVRLLRLLRLAPLLKNGGLLSGLLGRG